MHPIVAMIQLLARIAREQTDRLDELERRLDALEQWRDSLARP
jgi:hypothetical protein